MSTKLKNIKHPMQPIGFDEEGTIRFKRNNIVRHLLDNNNAGINLNTLSIETENQLIGYSTSGYGELSSSPKKTVRKADAIAVDLWEKKKKKMVKKSKENDV